MVSQNSEVNFQPLTRWLVSAAQAGYGYAVMNGLGWRLPEEFGLCVAGDCDLDQKVLNLYCSPQEAAWLKTASGFAVHLQNICFFFGGITFLLPAPEGFPLSKMMSVVVRKNCYPFEVFKKIEPGVGVDIDSALTGPLFFFQSR